MDTDAAVRRYVLVTTTYDLVHKLECAFTLRANREIAPFWGSQVWGKRHKNGEAYARGMVNAMNVPTPGGDARMNAARANAGNRVGSRGGRGGRTDGGRAPAYRGSDSGCDSRWSGTDHGRGGGSKQRCRGGRHSPTAAERGDNAWGYTSDDNPHHSSSASRQCVNRKSRSRRRSGSGKRSKDRSEHHPPHAYYPRVSHPTPRARTVLKSVAAAEAPIGKSSKGCAYPLTPRLQGAQTGDGR